MEAVGRCVTAAAARSRVTTGGMQAAGRWWLAATLLLAPAPARAVDLWTSSHGGAEAGGDVKTFLVGVRPRPHPLLPSEPSGRAALDLRLKLSAHVGEWLRVSLHPNLVATAGAGGGLGGLAASARVGDPPEGVSLSRNLLESSAVRVRLRLDRAAVTLHLPHVDLTAGRQPVSFGATFFFTPMDIVAPFTPLVVDREYKPGVDALRGDVYIGTSTTVTAVAAYAGGWDLEGLVFAARAGTTLGVFDVGFFAAEARAEQVLGVDVAGELLGTAVRAEATVTVPVDREKSFLRGALGLDRRFESGLTLMGELYVQTFGAASADRYLEQARDPRYARGEAWALGRYYAAVSAGYELLPVLNTAVAVIANLGDPSLAVGPSLTWSVSDEAVVVAGLYTPVGAPPDREPTGDPARPVRLRSEFGTMPQSAFLQMKAYF
ncbi:MAG: hypothetical protein HY904_21340 [Deltaproteobacteria bacterium]|nr:hypothetical protein [Deltaproteobacteria bacterium]